MFILSLVLAFLARGAAAEPTASRSTPDQAMLEAEQLLSDLGYWVLKVDGVADASTRHAIVAFQKVENRKPTGKLSAGDRKALKLAQRPVAKYPGGPHVEVDITRQVLFLTDEQGSVRYILPVSTGSEKEYFDQGKWQIAHTVRGRFKIYRKINGVRKAPLGSLYNPIYFYEGWAIHGSNSVPVKPASHGCVRIPRFADKAFSEIVPIATEVYVYD